MSTVRSGKLVKCAENFRFPSRNFAPLRVGGKILAHPTPPHPLTFHALPPTFVGMSAISWFRGDTVKDFPIRQGAIPSAVRVVKRVLTNRTEST